MWRQVCRSECEPGPEMPGKPQAMRDVCGFDAGFAGIGRCDLHAGLEHN